MSCGIFKLLGILLLSYVIYGVKARQIYGRYRYWGRMFGRDEEPWLYWSTIVSYVLLATALIFCFGKL